jgi:hypothetical protein
MDGRFSWVPVGSLVVSFLTLGIVIALLLRPPLSAPDSLPAVASLQAEVEAMRGDLAEMRTLVERVGTGAEPVDLSSLESRLDALEASMATLRTTVETMNNTARTICQLVADSPFTGEATC